MMGAQVFKGSVTDPASMWEKDLLAVAEAALAQAEVEPDAAEAVRRFFTRELQHYVMELNEVAQRHVGQSVGDPVLFSRFERATKAIQEAASRLEQRLPALIAKRVKAAFRSVIAPSVAGSPLIERAVAKPRGYPGDYMMMELRYDDRVKLGEGLQGFFDQYAFDHYRLIKQRNETIQRILTSYLLDSARSGRPMRAGSLGSGPSREWVDLNQQLSGRLASGAMLPQVTLTCLDRDVEALAYAKTRLQNNRLLQEVEFLPADLLKFAESEAWLRHIGQYDVVYSLGVANYFYDTTLNIILDTGLRMLKPGGELIVTHKALETFNFVFADWFCDWIFVQRSKAEFTRCFQEALAPFQGQYEWRLEWRADEEMFGIAKRLV